MNRLIKFIGDNLWRFERRQPPWAYVHSPLTERFGMFVFRWRQTWWWPGRWPLMFAFHEDYNEKTRGWNVVIRVIPLFFFGFQYRYPAWDRLELETSMRLGLFPGFPKEGAYMKTTFEKVWWRTRVLDYRNWQEAAAHHGH